MKEAWRTRSQLEHLSGSQVQGQADDAGFDRSLRCPLRYEADALERQWSDNDLRNFGNWGRYRHARFMPRWASRLTLRVTDVRVQRVQEISPSDAVAEGVFGDGRYATAPPLPYPVATFAELWDSINGKRPGCSWASNPWVWCVSFEVQQ